jgi:hypothetical protein
MTADGSGKGETKNGLMMWNPAGRQAAKSRAAGAHT